MDFNDLLEQVRRTRDVGCFSACVRGGCGRTLWVSESLVREIDDRHWRAVEAVISSMTLEERLLFVPLTDRRQQRIARGAGVSRSIVAEVFRMREQIVE